MRDKPPNEGYFQNPHRDEHYNLVAAENVISVDFKAPKAKAAPEAKPTERAAGECLDELVTFVRRFVVITPTQADAIVLWIAHSHAINAADATPYVAVTSAEKRSGKTLLLEVLELIVRRPLVTANISDAALFRAIGDDMRGTPTLLFDEVDAIFGAKARDREDLRGMLNAGYRRGAVVLRMGGGNNTTLEFFPVFCAKAFAGIGDALPDTIVDRSIPIRLQRRTRDEVVERFRRRDVKPEAEGLRNRIADWVEPQTDYLHDLRPDLPDELDDRAQDVWEPLLAIADLAGGDWPKRSRAAALELSAGDSREDDSLTTKLIHDIHTVFEEIGEKRLRTADLIEHLSRIEESPWGDWYGKPISPQKLSTLLRVYRIRTMSVWVDGEKKQGYKREQFADAFLRVQGSRGSRGSRPGSSIEAAPTPPTPPTPPHAKGKSNGRPPIGDPMYQVMLANAVRDEHLTDAEADQQYAIHQLVAGIQTELLEGGVGADSPPLLIRFAYD